MRIEQSFIQVPGIGEKTEQTLWEAGITDWRNGVETAPVGPKTGERLMAFVDRAQDALATRDVDFFATELPSRERWRLLESFRDRATALDIETTGLDASRDIVTTVTFNGPTGTRTLIRGDDLSRDRLLREFERSDLLLTYNGTQFDLPFIERNFDLSIDHPHVDLRFACARIGWSGGLKQIERHLGIDRDLPAVDGREAIRLWHQYQRGDSGALDRLVQYNREDTRTLFPVSDRVVGALDEQLFDPYIP